MQPRRFEYVPFGARAPEQAIACDGLVDGTALHLSHWAGNDTPAALKRDTSTEIALDWATSRDADCNLATATNNHFDTDGLLAVWALVDRERASRHRALLVAAAEAGDFDEWPDDDRGLWLEFAVTTMSERAGGDARAYAVALAEIGDVVERLEQRRELWERAWRELETALARAERGDVRVERHGPIDVFVHGVGVDELPGPALSRLGSAGARRWLLAFDRGEGRFDYRYERRRWAWADTVTRPVLAPPSRNALVAPLGRGWAIKGAGLGMTGLLRTSAPVTLAPETVAERLAAADREPPARTGRRDRSAL